MYIIYSTDPPRSPKALELPSDKRRLLNGNSLTRHGRGREGIDPIRRQYKTCGVSEDESDPVRNHRPDFDSHCVETLEAPLGEIR